MKWGTSAYFSGPSEALPFWVNPGLKVTTVFYAAALTIAGALLGIAPALKATGSRVQSQLRNLGAGGSTLRFGWVWTRVMIGQVALTVICLPPAMGISHEAIRDRVIRGRFPAEQYLAVRVDLDREASPTSAAAESASAFAARREVTYKELEPRVAQEPDVVVLACVEPARRALRIHPTEALKEA